MMGWDDTTLSLLRVQVRRQAVMTERYEKRDALCREISECA